MIPPLDELSSIPHAIATHRLATNGQRVWQVEDTPNIEAPDYDRRLGDESECQVVIWVDQQAGTNVPPGAAESAQGGLLGVDADAATKSREKVDCDLKDQTKKLGDPLLAQARKEVFILGPHEKLWHAPAPRLIQLPERAGLPKCASELVPLCIPRA